MFSPIQKLSDNLYIKRDDLLPVSFGGNKYRIALEFIADMKEMEKDCLIGYGNARSNLSRVLSALCYENNIPCYLVSPADEDGQRINTFNSLLCEKVCADFIYCDKQSVSKTIEEVMTSCISRGQNPYYINGDKFGKGNEKIPVKAYIKAYQEIVEEEDFDYIFLATGTGMTQSGLIAGHILNSGKEKIIGISVARDSEKEKKVIDNYLKCYFDTSSSFEKYITVEDSYLCGGYGKYTEVIEEVIVSTYKKYGIPLDPTYTGKAFYGMLQYIKQNKLDGKKCLFIHTGGTPLFFDYLNSHR